MINDLRSAFADVFGVREPRPYGTDRAIHQGFSDDVAGVQWNTGVDRRRGVWTLGVNLEGMKYDGWPIARFLERELAVPELPRLASTLPDRHRVELWLEREAWQASARPPILESAIGPSPPVLLGQLDDALWRAMASEAYDCLDPERGHRGRSRQTVTLLRAGLAEKDVAPHLQFKVVLSAPDGLAASGWGAELRRARNLLQPVHAFLWRRSGATE